MDKLIYRLDEVSRRLMRETRRAIVFTDNNMVRLIIKIPMTINEKDISTFDYVIKFLVDEVYHERVPDVEVGDGYVTISTLFDEKLTDSDGKLRFSFTGYTDGYRYSSTIATTDLKKTISLKGRETPATIESWLEEIRSAVKEGKAELDEALGDAVNIEVPSSISDLVNDKGFKTEEEVIALVEEHGKLKREIVDNLPAAEGANENAIYMVKNKEGEGFAEYMLVNGSWEALGSTDSIDLTGYVREEEIKYITESEVREMFN